MPPTIAALPRVSALPLRLDIAVIDRQVLYKAPPAESRACSPLVARVDAPEATTLGVLDAPALNTLVEGWASTVLEPTAVTMAEISIKKAIVSRVAKRKRKR